MYFAMLRFFILVSKNEREKNVCRIEKSIFFQGMSYSEFMTRGQTGDPDEVAHNEPPHLILRYLQI